MSSFGKLRALRHLQKKLLPVLHTAADLDIVLELGYSQDCTRPLGTKALLALNLGAPATISRRLSRLKKLGIVRVRSTQGDGRRHDLVLSASFRRNFESLSRASRRALA